MKPLGYPTSRRLLSSGDAAIGVTRDPHLDDRMAAALQFTDVNDHTWTVDLTLDDVARLYTHLRGLLAADAPTVSNWWTQLADGTDGRPRAVPRSVTPASGP